MINVGIVGTGQIFDLNILGYLDNEDARIVALCNRTTEKAEKKRAQFDLPDDIPIYSNCTEMFEKEELDLVEILLPHHLHVDAVCLAAKKGIDVVSVQKPIARTLQEADKMIQTCENAGTLLSVYENFFSDPHLKKAKKLITDDYIGDISSIRIKVALAGKGGWEIPQGAKEWRADPEKLGGAKEGSPILFDNGWHAFALGWWFYDEPIEKVHAWTGNLKNTDAPAYVKWKCKRDFNKKHVVPQYGNIEFTLMPEMKIPSKYYPTDEFIEIIGSRGIMKLNQCTAQGNTMSESDVFKPIVIIRDGKVETIDDSPGDWKQSFINATHHVIETAKGNAEPLLSGEQAREVLKFNLAAIQSAQREKEIFLDEFSSPAK
ncbi:MAG: Gfo/Idh/MocA family oxidoreductase [Promethearchaeia archaeon]